MNNNNGFGSPIRTYKQPNRQNPLRTVAVLVMTAIIIAFVVVLIMSLTGTGLFADKKDGGGPKVDPPSSSTEESGEGTSEGEGTSDPGTSSEDPGIVKYTSINKTAADLHYGLLQLINEEHLYKFKEEALLESMYENRPTLKSYQLSKSTHMLKYSALTALNEMMDDFYTATGFGHFNVKTTYRSFDEQKELHDKNNNVYNSPGASDYHSGATINFTGYDKENNKSVNLDTASEAKWLKEHAHEYGFVFQETWQIRYVGVPHAEYMLENSLNLEGYLKKLATDHRYGTTHLIIESVDGNTYEIYYVSAPSEGILKLFVPENRPYTVSGDNVGGFVVTVTVEEGKPAVTPDASSDAA